jgi:hypothetical protein
MRFRVNDHEYESIRAAAAEAGMAYGAFIVHRLEEAGRGRSPGRHAEMRELSEQLRALARQINRVGVNLNQLTRIAHATGGEPHELRSAMEYLVRVLRRTDAAVAEVGRRLK